MKYRNKHVSRVIVTAGALVLMTQLSPAAQMAAQMAASKAEPTQAQPKQVESKQIEQIVHDYILKNPEVLLEAVRSYDERTKEAAKEQAREKVRTSGDELYHDTSPASKADKESPDSVTVVEFFDYRCGYCKKVEDVVTGLSQRPGVRIVYKDLPILGPDSLIAAQAALAAQNQGAYQSFHHSLLASAVELNKKAILDLAAHAGLDVARLEKDMASPAIADSLKRNGELAAKLGVQATPTFVVGQEVVSGALTPEAFRTLIDGARSQPSLAKPQPEKGL